MAGAHPVAFHRWRLKNKKLTTLTNRANNSFDEERSFGSNVVEDILCTGFDTITLLGLLPHELAVLEVSCQSLRATLSRESSLLLWGAAVYASLRCHRLTISPKEFVGMTVRQIKSMMSYMKFARGPLDGGLGRVVLSHEFSMLSSICRATALRSSNFRVVASLLHFRQRFFYCDEDAEDENDVQAHEGALLLSDATSFFWPGNGAYKKGAMLKASLACLPGIILLEVSHVFKTLGISLTLSIDAHLVSPLWPQGLKVEGVKVHVGGSCVPLPIPVSDSPHEKVREALMGADGMLCVLVIRSVPS